MRTEISITSYSVQIQIVTYNSAPYLGRCLQSIQRQSLLPDRVVVIDNASSDDFMSAALEYVPSADVITLPQNVGYAAAHNIGFELAMDAGVEWVLTVNPDSELANDYVAQILAEAVYIPNCGGVSGKLVRSRSTASVGTGLILDSAGLEMQRLFHVRDIGSGKADIPTYQEKARVWGISGAAALYNVSMLQDVCLNGDVFDERFFVYKEDVDLCWRAQRRGWQFWYIPSAMAYHARGWGLHNKVLPLAASHSFANQVALLLRHVPSFDIWVAFAVIVEVFRWTLMLVRYPQVAVKALGLILRNYRYQLRIRCELKLADRVGGEVLRDLCRPRDL